MSNPTDTNIDISILELLASKICHDLISPIGAVNNGIEFLEDMGADAGQEVIDLISFSAAQASAKLQAYRMAYGAGGADTHIKPEDVFKTIEAIVGAEKKIRQEWDPHKSLGFSEYPRGFAKMMTCALLLGMECLPKGGILAVEKGHTDNSFVVTARGTDAGLRGTAPKALNLSMHLDVIEPKYVHAYMTGLMAKRYAFGIETSGGDGFVQLTFTCL